LLLAVISEDESFRLARNPFPTGRHTPEVIRFQELFVMSPGVSIAHYRISSKLGEGGMGAVYRATDTKLNREVAIKVLPDTFAGDADRLARFAREAQVLAALNHPNIASIYGVEERARHGAGGGRDAPRTPHRRRSAAGGPPIDRCSGVRARERDR